MKKLSKSSPRVVVVVVTHDGRQWLSKCLQSIAGQTYSNFEVIVVDSASQTRIAAMVEKAIPAAEFIRLDNNAGFGAAANLALERSTHAPSAGYYLFVHDDVVMDKDFLRQMVQAALETDAGVVGGKGLSLDQPNLLLEVGLSADQLGFPFTGLETGEIDQEQHDQRKEVLFVTNACTLVSKALIEKAGSWDGGYFAFGEDLDLCIRGRLAGFRVVFEPRARFHHAVALATGKRPSVEGSVRFLTRRNRLRTIAKTAAAYRLWAVLLLYLVVVASEIFLLASLRRFDELPAYPRAFTSFFRSIPDVIRRRRAVQKRRAIPDRKIRRLMTSDLRRARVFAERRLREWEVGTLQLGERALSMLRPSTLKAGFARWIRKPATLPVAAVVVALVFAARSTLFGGGISSGGIWPFPESNWTLFTDYFAPWRNVGLGTASAAPPALPLLWLIGLASFGIGALAQLFLIVTLLTAGLAGIYRAASRRTDRVTIKVIVLAVYSLGPVTQLAIEKADLGSLAMFAALPYLLEIALRMLGATPSQDGDRPATAPSADAMVQDAVRLALLSAALVALAPSALIALIVLWLAISSHSYWTAWDRRELLTRSGWLLRAVLVTVLLLLPWTIEALRPKGAILGPIFSGAGGGATFRPLWESFSFSNFFFLVPAGGIAASIGAGAILIGATALSTPSRRKESRMLVTVVIVFAFIGGLAALGWIPAPVASAGMWMMIPLVALSVAACHLAAGLAEELPRHAAGLRHLGALIVTAVVVAGLGWGWGARFTLWNPPASTLAGPFDDRSQALGSFFTSTAADSGDFRILWLGRTWADPVRPGLRRIDGASYFLTGPGGLTMRNLYEPPPAEGERRLDEVVHAIVGNTVDHAGHLMAPMGIRFVIADARDSELISSMDRQRDFKLEQSEVAVFRNLQWIPRAVFSPHGFDQIASTSGFDPKSLMLADWEGGRAVRAVSQSSFREAVPRTRYPSVVVGDNHNSGWHAKAGDASLESEPVFGWANRFDLPEDAHGKISIRYSRRWPRLVWVGLQLFALSLTVAMARLRMGTKSSLPQVAVLSGGATE